MEEACEARSVPGRGARRRRPRLGARRRRPRLGARPRPTGRRRLATGERRRPRRPAPLPRRPRERHRQRPRPGSLRRHGDGPPDALVGAWLWDKTPTNDIGAAYVILGGEGLAGAPLADPVTANAIRIDGPAVASARLGQPAACLGDINGDGLDDLAIANRAGRVYVVYGAEGFTGLTLDSLGDRGFVVDGPAGVTFGFGVGGVGNLNGDGKDEYAIRGVVADTRGRTNNGKVWVLAGRDEISNVQVENAEPGVVLFTVDGARNQDRLSAIGRVGDVNGDGIDDLGLGAYTGNSWGHSGIGSTGAAYVVFGGSTGELDALDLGTSGFVIRGPIRRNDMLGGTIAPAGDVNGDGKADLLIGAAGLGSINYGPRNGGAAVVFGSDSTATVYTDPTATPGQSVFTCEGTVTDPRTCETPGRRGYWIDGVADDDATGDSIAGLGDVNGDGVPDHALGAYLHDAPTENGPLSGAGAAFVVYGDPDAVVISLAGLADTTGYRIDGTAAGENLGREVAAGGDMDGNGVPDLVIGADKAARPTVESGEVTIALLGELGSSVTLTGPTSVRVGEPATFRADLDAPAAADLTGASIAFAIGGVPIEGCEAVAVDDGAAECSATFAEDVAGDVVATFSGTDAVAASTSAPLGFAAVTATTETSLVVSDDEPAAGQVVLLSAHVVAADNGAVPGSVRFTSDGVAIPGCAAVTVTGDGWAVCSTAWAADGTFEVVASYGGAVGVAPSESAPSTVTVGATTVDPRTPTESFVTAALVDFLGGEPTDAQVAAGVAQVTASGKPAFLRSLTTSDAWLTAIVDRLYQDTLGRPSDAAGAEFWRGRIRGGWSVARVAASFCASPEYYEGIGGGTDRTWVTDLYLKILLRSPGTGDVDYWEAETVARGRGNVALRFYQTSESARTRVTALYQDLLGRAPEPDGLAHWAPRVVREGDLALAVQLANSGEYQARANRRFP